VPRLIELDGRSMNRRGSFQRHARCLRERMRISVGRVVCRPSVWRCALVERVRIRGPVRYEWGAGRWSGGEQPLPNPDRAIESVRPVVVISVG
jgi:hypothetical protein